MNTQQKLVQENLLPTLENDNGGIGCRDDNRIKKFYETTAGKY